MDKNSTYNQSSGRPDIDVAWEKMGQILDKEMPVIKNPGGGNGGRGFWGWGIAVFLAVAVSIIIYTSKNSDGNLIQASKVSIKENSLDTLKVKLDPALLAKKQINILDVSTGNGLHNNTSNQHQDVDDEIGTGLLNKNIVQKAEKLKGEVKQETIFVSNPKNIERKDIANLKFNRTGSPPLLPIKKTPADQGKISSIDAPNHNPMQEDNTIATKDKSTKKAAVKGLFDLQQQVLKNIELIKNDKEAKSVHEADSKTPQLKNGLEAMNIFDSGIVKPDDKNKKNGTANLSANKNIVLKEGAIADVAIAKINSANSKPDHKIKNGLKNYPQNSISLKPQFFAGISPSLSLQHAGYSGSSFLNYLSAMDPNMQVRVPISKKLSIGIGFHPFAGTPLKSGNWMNALDSLYSENVSSDTSGHSISTVTSYNVAGLKSINIPVTVGYSISPKLNVYAGLQLSLNNYGGVVKNVIITDSSIAGVNKKLISHEENIFKTDNVDAIKKTGLSAVAGISYQLNRFALGLQYTKGLSDLTNNSFLHNTDKNFIGDLKLTLQINLSKKKK